MSKTTTPMMKQYRQIKSQLPDDVILFFRLGDFYEMFFDDAQEAAAILDIALTKRNQTPMCGIPYHASEGYLAKLVRAGKKVAICDQVEEAGASKGIVRRDITRVITPGTVVEEQVLESGRNNYLAALVIEPKRYGMALLDLSTGDFWLEESSDAAAIQENLTRYAPSECIIPEAEQENPDYQVLLQGNLSSLATPYEDWTFENEAAGDLLTRHFKVSTLDGFGASDCSVGVGAAGAILHYVTKQLRRGVDHIGRLQVKNPRDYLVLDEATTTNLELVENRGAAGANATLLKTLDATCTAMGSRRLREWILRPLTDRARIEARHEAVQALVDDRARLRTVQDALREVRDLERIITRLNAGNGNARDMRAIGQSLAALPALRETVQDHPVARLAELAEQLSLLPEVVELVDQALVEEPPLTIKDGGIIREGYHAELDELREAAQKGRQWLADYQAAEQTRTGIKSLKVRHNKVFGFYIEVTKSNLDGVPEDYIRKQTLVNAERFITPELKEYENKILGAQDRATELEYQLFLDIREQVTAHTHTIQQTAEAVAELDILAGFADRAARMHYVCPVLSEDTKLQIVDGRHPVVEHLNDIEGFVPNDASLDTLDNQLIIITGPNMAGKSTYIRQVALIVIMAQMGSFVPAAEAHIGLVDRVFTRVGASDDMARGRSTFMVEMHETANILNNATGNSLIVLDEIGRGTSTFDGISIAWAVAEYLHNHAEVKARTLFATHYHELTDLSRTLPGVKNYSVLVRERNDQIAFLHKIAPGAADKSYGIQVAQLAGMPEPVVDRAKEILRNLEEGEFTEAGQPALAEKRPRKSKVIENQLSFFDRE